jgi:hypothetical protein
MRITESAVKMTGGKFLVPDFETDEALKREQQLDGESFSYEEHFLEDFHKQLGIWSHIYGPDRR